MNDKAFQQADLFFQGPAIQDELLRRQRSYGGCLLGAAQHALLLSLKIDISPLHSMTLTLHVTMIVMHP